VRDPGTGFRRETLAHAAAGKAAGPAAHLEPRAEMGMRPSGFGILLAQPN
jgi:hypothetical protein